LNRLSTETEYFKVSYNKTTTLSRYSTILFFAMIPFTTQRLTIRELNLADAPFILELVNTPGWLQYIGDRKIHSTIDAEKYLLEGPLNSYKKNGFGLYMVERTQDNIALGICGLLKREYLEFPDLGFAFLPEHFGHGYAYEATDACLTMATTTFGFNSVQAITTPNNQSSISLLKKIGFQFKSAMKDPASEAALSLFQRNQ